MSHVCVSVSHWCRAEVKQSDGEAPPSGDILWPGCPRNGVTRTCITAGQHLALALSSCAPPPDPWMAIMHSPRIPYLGGSQGAMSTHRPGQVLGKAAGPSPEPPMLCLPCCHSRGKKPPDPGCGAGVRVFMALEPEPGLHQRTAWQ